jgi:hypothetical protein
METTKVQANHPVVYSLLCIIAILAFSSNVFAQTGMLPQGTTGYIRIESQFQAADTVFVWGDINSGTYLVPKGTTLLELISYAGWVGGNRGGFNSDAQFRWIKRRAEVIINPVNSTLPPRYYELQFDKPLNEQFRSITVNNYDVVSVSIKRKPMARDYLAVWGPVFSFAVTVVFLARNW